MKQEKGVPNRARKDADVVNVLEEEDYTEVLDAIIKRDFFPSAQDEEENLNELPNLKKRPFNDSWDDTPAGTPQVPIAQQPPEVALKESAKKMKLNNFTATHTSEDNASFAEIQQEEIRKKKEKLAWMYDPERKAIEYKEKILNGDPNQMYGEMLTWDYKTKSALMWHPDGINEDKLEEKKKSKTPMLVYENTRFEDGFKQPLPKPKRKKVDSRGNEKIGGFGMVYTPDIVPGSGGNTPFTTWGTIDGTPMILEEDKGPSFKILETSEKDKTLERMNKKNEPKKKKEKKIE